MLSDKNARKTPYKKIWRVALLLAAVAAIGCGYTLLDEGTRAELISPHVVLPELVKKSPVKRFAAGTAERLRQVFRYSVVPGGVQSPAEARKAADLDPVVRDHYKDIELSKVKTEVLGKNTLAYVSYRINDQVYWTRNKVQLHQGELLLTDGKNAIRARCGNRISAAPVPTYAASEPKPAEFEIAQLTAPPMPLDPATVDAPSTPPTSGAALASNARHIPAAPMSAGFIASSTNKWKYVAPIAAGAGAAAWATSRSGSKSTPDALNRYTSEPNPPVGPPVHTPPPPMGPPVTVTPEPATFTGLLGIGLGWLFLRSLEKSRS